MRIYKTEPQLPDHTEHEPWIRKTAGAMLFSMGAGALPAGACERAPDSELFACPQTFMLSRHLDEIENFTSTSAKAGTATVFVGTSLYAPGPAVRYPEPIKG